MYKDQGPSDQFFIFVVKDQGDDHSNTAIVTVAVGRYASAMSDSRVL